MGNTIKVVGAGESSNPRLQPWQGCALPLSYARKLLKFKTVIL